MDCRDFMVGDWVKVSHLNKIGKIYRIDRANGDGWVAVIDGDYHETNIDPIPLTDEILVTNNYLSNAYSYYIKSIEYKYFHISKLNETAWVVDVNFPASTVLSIAVKYVHQLQHALRLCGIDKEITV